MNSFNKHLLSSLHGHALPLQSLALAKDTFCFSQELSDWVGDSCHTAGRE
jgi:hypothetical protein